MTGRAKKLAITALVLLLAAALTPVLVRVAAHRALAAAGFTEARGGSVTIRPDHLRIDDLRIGTRSSASFILSWSPGGLLHGHLDAIAIPALVLHGSLEWNGSLTLDGYHPPATAPETSSAAGPPPRSPADAIRIENAKLILDTPAGEMALSADATLANVPDGLALNGSLALDHSAMSGRAPIALALTGGGWHVALDPVELTAKAGGTVHGTVDLAGGGGRPLRGKAGLAGDKLRVGGLSLRSSKLDFSAGDAGLTASIHLIPESGGAGLDADLASNSNGLSAKFGLALDDGRTLGLAGMPAGPVRGSASIALRSAPSPGAPRPLSVEGGFDGGLPGGASIGGAKLSLSGAMAKDGALTLAACAPLAIRSLVLPGIAVTELSGCIGPTDRAVYRRMPDGATALNLDVRTLVATALAGSVELAVQVPSAHAGVTLRNGALEGFDGAIHGGHLGLPQLEASFASIESSGGRAADGSLSGTLQAAFGPDGKPGLPVSGTLSGASASAPALTMSLGSTWQPPFVKASVTGPTATLDLASTELGPGGADLATLLPGIGRTITGLAGTLGLHIEADWSRRPLAGRGAITVQGLQLNAAGYAIEGLDGSVRIAALSPLTTEPDQHVTMKRLNVGVPLEDGDLRFALNHRNMLDIADAHWRVAGGTIGTYDQHLDLYGPEQRMAFVVRDVDLAQALALAGMKDLAGEGRLEGAIPIRHTGDTIFVEGGKLRTTGPGTVRYDPAEIPPFLQGEPGQGPAILREALRDFHYQELGLAIDEVLGGEETVKVSVKGANPKLYGGAPISVTVNLSGALDSIARTSIEAYTRPTETVRKHMPNKGGGKK